MAKKKEIKEPIRIREKKLANGNTSLYFDIYLNGTRRYEFLKLYLIPEHNKADRDKNKETLALANSIKAQRIVSMRNKEFGFKDDYAEDTLFYDYYCAMTEARLGSLGNWGNWKSAIRHMEKYDPKLKRRTFAEITPKWIEGFKDYLVKEACAWSCDFRDRIKDRPLSQNSRQSYFNKLRACINDAFDKGLLRRNPLRGIENIKAEEGTRMYLTIDEIRKLAATDCKYIDIKRAFLFSCLTGLRRSDIAKLTWGEVQIQGDFTRIIFKQKKTGGQEYLDITTEAAELMGERGKDDETVFGDIKSPSKTNTVIRVWVYKAGINKEITFHCGRHTLYFPKTMTITI